MADNVVGIDIVARLDAFRAELAKIPDIGSTEAKALTAQLSKEIKGAERAGRAAAKAAREARTETRDMGETFGRAGSSAAKLAGALDLIAPGAGEAARAVADLADVGEVASGASGLLGGASSSLALALGPVVAAVGLAGVATYEYMQRQEEAAERSRDYVIALSDIRRGYDEISDALAELEVREGVLSGVLSLGDAEFLRAQGAAEQVFAAQRGRVVDQLQQEADRLAAIGAAQRNTGILDLFFGATEGELAAEQRVVEERISSLQDSLRGLDGQQGDYAERLADVTTGERESAEAKRGQAEAARAVERATRAQAEALRELNDQLHAEEAAGEAQRAAYDAAIAKLGELEAADRAAMGTASERMQREHEAAQQAIADLREQALVAAETATAREAVEAESLAASRAEHERYAAAVQALHDDTYRTVTQQAEQAAAQQAAAQQAAWGSVVDGVGAALGAIEDYFGQESAAGKAAAAAQLVLGEIELLAKAASLGPAAPLYIAAGQVPLALAAAKLAGFNDTPGPIQVPEQGAAYRFAPRDIVVAGRTPEAAQRQLDQLTGGGGGGSTTVVQLQLSGRTAQQVVTQASRGRRGMGRRDTVGQKRRKG